jgi:hypothetical protein
MFNPGEQYSSTDYEDCYVSDLASWLFSRSRMGIVAPPGTPLRHRHNRAHANKLARHSKRPNGRPKHR